MNELTKIEAQAQANNFQQSDLWRQFLIKFAANFYELNAEKSQFPAFFNMAMEFSHSMPLLLETLDIVSNHGEQRRPAETMIRKVFWDLYHTRKKPTVSKTHCNICNNTHNVTIVEAMINGTQQLLNPKQPQPCKAYHALATCVCSGGKQEDADMRFEAPKENDIRLYGLEFVTANSFIYDCEILLRNQAKGGK